MSLPPHAIAYILGTLPLQAHTLPAHVSCAELACYFQAHPTACGVLLVAPDQKPQALVSRRSFFPWFAQSRPCPQEALLVQEDLWPAAREFLVLKSYLPLHEALPQTLARHDAHEPLVVHLPEGLRLLDLHDLLLACARLPAPVGCDKTVSQRVLEEAAHREEALRHVEQRFALYLRETPLAVIEWSPTFEVQEWNLAAERIFGFSREEVLGHHLFELLVPEGYREHVRHVWQELLAQKGGRRSTYDNLTRDGQRITCEWFNTPLVDEAGRVIGVASLAQDITERVRSEAQLKRSEALGKKTAAELAFRVEALKASEHRLRQQNQVLGNLTRRKIKDANDLNSMLRAITEATANMLEAGLTSIWLYTPDRTRLYCVDRYVRSAGQHTCISGGADAPSLDSICFPAYFQALAQERTIAVQDVQTDPRTRDLADLLNAHGIGALLDATVWQEGQVVGVVCHGHTSGPRVWAPEEQNFAGSIADLVSLVLEIEQRKKAVVELAQKAEALHRAEVKYRSIFENAIEGIFQTTSQGQYLSANPALARMYGYDTPEELMASMTEIDRQLYVIPERRAEFIRLIHTQGFVSAFESQVYRKDGSVIWISENARIVTDSQGQVLYYEGSTENITERKRDEGIRRRAEEHRLALERARQLELQMTELQKLNQLKDDFLSTVSHELRTPMTNMKMAIHLLRTANTPEESERYLQVLEAECAREADLIKDLLDLQRLELGAKPPEAEEIDLKQWLPVVLQPFFARAQLHGQTLTLEVVSACFTTDGYSLERILTELVANACKYTPPQGTIAVTVRAVTLQSQAALCFSVRNTGSEIPSRELPRIFEKFYRVPSHDPWRKGGTGLGLALVKKLVEQLYGQISVQSQAGETTFCVFLPILPSPRNPAR
ncbi:PAS domain S-box protein [Anthocerotibacter panamensis]|uniref:PAS domain S-box protein n=1 Tax=Anthocerotibacter panamensis TaxID=2857077 RepID=UPI001C403A73|nr:PAS domain S-box protein [Anthocerotibacter panamensis]